MRTDGDTWDIATSVGTTAVMVAAARAAETRSDAPLISDPFAQVLVERSGAGMWAAIANEEMGEKIRAIDPEIEQIMQNNINYQAVRTRFFDDFFDQASRAGLRQVVILAAGLDSRAYRLPWPGGTTVYEIDQPLVLQYKRQTLDEYGAAPTATRREVPADLRDDWPAALKAQGFDPAVPTAWLAEGLLMYLPTDAQDRLFELIAELSAQGSRIAVEAVGPDNAKRQQIRDKMRERFERVRKIAGFDGEAVDIGALMYHDQDRTDVGQWLTESGWTVRSVPTEVAMEEAGRPPQGDERAPGNTLVAAVLGR